MPHPLAEFYRGKRLLVTGHTGFAAGWLVAWLKLLEAKICAYAPPPARRPSFFDVTLLDRGIRSIFGDLRDRQTLANAFVDFEPEIVVHVAGQPGTRSPDLDVAEVFSRNALGTLHLLEEARLTRSVRAIVIATSDACYEHRNWFWGAREEDPLGAHDPSGASLAASELISSAFLRSLLETTTVGLATARMPEGIGGGDWELERPVPRFVRAITCELPVTPGSARVAVWHVLDAARACLLVAKALCESSARHCGAWNFGPPVASLMSEHELAKQFIELWGAGELRTPRHESVAEAGTVPLNTGKAQSELGWLPVLATRDAIAWTVDWYKAFYRDPSSAWRTTEDQLDRYTRLMRA